MSFLSKKAILLVIIFELFREKRAICGLNSFKLLTDKSLPIKSDFANDTKNFTIYINSEKIDLISKSTT